jgi:hypothetical protein
MVRLWVKKNKGQFGASEWCRICGRYDVNLTPFPFLMCSGGADGEGGEHPPVAMIRVHQKKGHRPKPNRLINPYG